MTLFRLVSSCTSACVVIIVVNEVRRPELRTCYLFICIKLSFAPKAILIARFFQLKALHSLRGVHNSYLPFGVCCKKGCSSPETERTLFAERAIIPISKK